MRKLMDNHNQEHEAYANGTWGFFAGLLIGALAGAVAMLLLAPQSGKKTRAKLQRQSHKLRDQTTEAVEDAMAQARATAHQIAEGVHEKAEELKI